MSEHVEPLDARKTRALTLENMKLTREVERLRGHQVSFCKNHLIKSTFILKGRGGAIEAGADTSPEQAGGGEKHPGEHPGLCPFEYSHAC